MKDLKIIKTQLAKKAPEFISGGFKPTNSITESWIGRVYLYHENEEIPLDNDGELMLPLFQLCFNDLPFVPEILDLDRKSTRLNSSHNSPSRMPSSA